MRTGFKSLSFAAALAVFATGGAFAQQGSSASGQKSGVSAGASGVTSGPAATGQPATLGANGVTPAVPHQTESLHNEGGVAMTGSKGDARK